MNPKLVSSIRRSVQRIVDDQFDERDVKSLLADVRDFVRGETLREICDFVAHPKERDKGLSLNSANIRYWQLKYLSVVDLPPAPRFDLQRIPLVEFKLLLGAMEAIEEGFYVKYHGLTKDRAVKLVNGSYKKDGKLWVVHKNPPRVTRLVDWVRRNIIAEAIAGQEELVASLHLAAGRILHESVSDRMLEFSDGLMLCLISHLQGARLKLYDGEVATLVVVVEPSPRNPPRRPLRNKPGTLRVDAQFSIEHWGRPWTVPIIATNLYPDERFGALGYDHAKDHELPLFSVERNSEGRLRAVPA